VSYYTVRAQPRFAILQQTKYERQQEGRPGVIERGIDGGFLSPLALPAARQMTAEDTAVAITHAFLPVSIAPPPPPGSSEVRALSKGGELGAQHDQAGAGYDQELVNSTFTHYRCCGTRIPALWWCTGNCRGGWAWAAVHIHLFETMGKERPLNAITLGLAEDPGDAAPRRLPVSWLGRKLMQGKTEAHSGPLCPYFSFLKGLQAPVMRRGNRHLLAVLDTSTPERENPANENGFPCNEGSP